MTRVVKFEGRTISVPDDATDDEVAEILESSAPKKAKLTPEQIEAHAKKAFKSSARAEAPIQAEVIDFLAGLSSTARGALNLIPNLPEWLKPKLPHTVDKESGTYLAGQIADPAAMAIGMGAGKLAQGASVIPKMGWLTSPTMQGIIGGAAGGAAVGGLSEDSGALEGGMLGGVVGGALPTVGRGAGYAWDRLSGKTSALRAKDVISQVYDDKLPQARSLWQNADPTLTASQAAAPTGSTTGAALGARSAKMQSGVYSQIADDQLAANRAILANEAGGDTQQTARNAQKAAKDRLTAATNPMREGELSTANIGGEVIKRIQPQIDAIEAQKLAVIAAQKQADDAARQFGGTASDNSSKALAKLDAQKDFLQRQIDSMSSYGLSPLETSKTTAEIVKRVSDPKIAANSLHQNAMKNVASEIAAWEAKNKGVIDAQALYSIRKNAVQAAVQSQLSGASPKAQARAAAGALSAIEPMIDDAIIAAGGSGWKNYLNTYAQGMKEINRLELGAKAMKLFENSPKQFVKLLENNSPEVVQKIFKSQSDVVMAMAQGYQPLKKVSDAVARDKDLAKRASDGGVELALMLQDKAAKVWVPKLIDWKLAAAREVGDILESQLNKATMNKVYTAMQSGKTAEEIMNIIPAKERVAFLNILYTGRGTPLAVSTAQLAEKDEEEQ